MIWWLLQGKLKEYEPDFVSFLKWDYSGCDSTWRWKSLNDILGRKPSTSSSRELYLMIFALLIGYVYQQTNNFIGHILAHNMVRGSGITIMYLLLLY